MRILVSACLLGLRCRYDGASKPHPGVIALAEHHELVPVCPEQLGGLPTPRPPAERQGMFVRTRESDVTEQYRRGAEEVLELCKLLRCEAAVMKEKSPSCGCGQIYDGTFTGTLREGNGITAELLIQNDVVVYGESRIEELMK